MKGIAPIKIKVYLPAFVNHERLNPDGTASLEESASMQDLYRLLKLPVPLRLSVFFRVNYEPARWNTQLKEGDTVTFLFPISGG